jgi:hypothetical protein
MSETMVNSWLLLHLLALGIWIGCVATETIVEHSVRDDAARDYVARVHWPIDLYVEVPAFVLVSLSGFMLWRQAQPDVMLSIKVAAGSLGVLANIACVCIVWARARARAKCNAAGYRRLDDAQHKFGAVLVLLLATALGLGIYRAAS